MTSLNYRPGRIDGLWGKNTVGAVASFQHDHDLPVSDAWTPACRAALEEALSKGRVATVSETRATATVADVKAAGVSVVAYGQTIARTGAGLVIAGVTKAVTDGDGTLSIDKANDLVTQARAAKSWLESVTGLVGDFGSWITAHPVLAIAIIGGVAVIYGGKIARDAVVAYRQGRV